MSDTSSQTKDKTGLLSRSLLLVCILLFANQVNAQSAETSRILQRLTHERQMVTDQLDQFSKTLELLRTDGERRKDFGRKVTSKNIEKHVKRIRRDRNRYAQDHPEDVKEVLDKAEETADWRRGRA